MTPEKPLQNGTSNNSVGQIRIQDGVPDTISFWIGAYLLYEVTTSEASRKEQRRDLNRFRNFMLAPGGEERRLRTSRLSQAFKEAQHKEGPGGSPDTATGPSTGSWPI